MNHALSPIAGETLRAIVTYKHTHDGNAPALGDLADILGHSKSSIWQAVRKLEAAGLLQRAPGKGRTLMVKGGHWQWAVPQPYPDGRIGDVLRVVVTHKAAHDGNAPDHREIAASLGVVYSGSIKVYLDELSEQGYITTAYATNRYIAVTGGQWTCDEAWLTGQIAAGRQMSLLD